MRTYPAGRPLRRGRGEGVVAGLVPELPQQSGKEARRPATCVRPVPTVARLAGGGLGRVLGRSGLLQHRLVLGLEGQLERGERARLLLLAGRGRRAGTRRAALVEAGALAAAATRGVVPRVRRRDRADRRRWRRCSCWSHGDESQRRRDQEDRLCREHGVVIRAPQAGAVEPRRRGQADPDPEDTVAVPHGQGRRQGRTSQGGGWSFCGAATNENGMTINARRPGQGHRGGERSTAGVVSWQCSGGVLRAPAAGALGF